MTKASRKLSDKSLTIGYKILIVFENRTNVGKAVSVTEVVRALNIKYQPMTFDERAVRSFVTDCYVKNLLDRDKLSKTVGKTPCYHYYLSEKGQAYLQQLKEKTNA